MTFFVFVLLRLVDLARAVVRVGVRLTAAFFGAGFRRAVVFAFGVVLRRRSEPLMPRDPLVDLGLYGPLHDSTARSFADEWLVA